jgi:hypothetical protein
MLKKFFLLNNLGFKRGSNKNKFYNGINNIIFNAFANKTVVASADKSSKI